MSLYISPNASKEGNESPLPPPPPVNLRPELNEKLLNRRVKRELPFPPGTFSNNSHRSPLMSRRWGRPPFFTNAKPASMLERGLKRNKEALVPGQKGILTTNDGPEEEVQVVSVSRKQSPKKVNVYTFMNSSGEIFDKDDLDRFEEWDFYTVVEPKPFVPRKGGAKRKSKRKTRRKA